MSSREMLVTRGRAEHLILVLVQDDSYYGAIFNLSWGLCGWGRQGSAREEEREKSAIGLASSASSHELEPRISSATRFPPYELPIRSYDPIHRPASGLVEQPETELLIKARTRWQPGLLQVPTAANQTRVARCEGRTRSLCRSYTMYPHLKSRKKNRERGRGRERARQDP